MSAGNESDGSAGGCRAVQCEVKTPEEAEGGGAFFSSDVGTGKTSMKLVSSRDARCVRRRGGSAEQKICIGLLEKHIDR